MQPYLTDNETTIEEKINLFHWRTFMAKGVGENFRGGRSQIDCKVCGVHRDNQKEIFNNCIQLKYHIDPDLNYEDIFQGEISSKLCKTITRIMKKR